MTDETEILRSLLPVILLLGLGVAAAVGSRALRLSPIVGYLVLGVALQGAGLRGMERWPVVAMMAQLGVVFLLFDIGLHFSLSHVRAYASDIFGFGPVQVLAGTLGLGAACWIAGIPPAAAFFTGATLALSSTAVVARLISERQQQSCPVGLTATAILVFQDVAAIFLLIIAQAMVDGGGIAVAVALALAKAAGAFAVAVLLSRVLVRPVFGLVASGRHEEVFTAMALLVALGAGWLSGQIGLSLSLGAFLGGMMISETPFRPVVQAEIKPFRGLLLGFFFISVGLSMDTDVLVRFWPAVLAATVALMLLKALTNGAASLLFRWSVPGSTQLGFLLAQGSEFTFVVLSVPPVRAMVGESRASVLMAAVALSLAATPQMAAAGRWLAGQMRTGHRRRLELKPLDTTGPVIISGMGPPGRTLADALENFEIGYLALEGDPQRLADAIADGYRVTFGDLSDPRLWEPVSMHGRRLVAMTAPRIELVEELTPTARALYPDVKGYALVQSQAERDRFIALELNAVLDTQPPPGLDLAQAVLLEMGVSPDSIASWARQQQKRASMAPGEQLVAA